MTQEENDQGASSSREEETKAPTSPEGSLQKKLDELSPSKRKALLSYPMWNDSKEVKWVEKDGIVVVEYPKNFSRFEKWMHGKIGGPSTIKRPLDKIGSDMWRLCDGKHTLLDICRVMSGKYKEEIEPVFKRVPTFISQLFMLGLVIPRTREEMEREKAEIVEEVEL